MTVVSGVVKKEVVVLPWGVEVVMLLVVCFAEEVVLLVILVVDIFEDVVAEVEPGSFLTATLGVN